MIDETERQGQDEHVAETQGGSGGHAGGEGWRMEYRLEPATVSVRCELVVERDFELGE